MILQKFVFSRKTYLKCYISSYILICQPQPFVPLAIIKNCARDLSISKSWNHEPLYVLKRTVTLLNGFQPLGLQIKEGVLQLANQGESTLACKSRPTYISSNVTFERSGIENCTNMLCEIVLQIHAAQIYAVQYILSKYLEGKYMLCKQMLCKYMECKYMLCNG